VGVNASLRREIADRQRAEAALRERDALFNAFMRNSPAAAWMKDADGTYRFANETTCSLFGRPLDTLLGSTDFEIWPRDIANEIVRSDLATLASDVASEVTEMIPAGEGRQRRILWYKFPVTDASGARFLGGMGIDVTEVLEAQEELARSEGALRHQTAILQSILDSMGDGVVVADEAGRAFVFNPAAREILGIGRPEASADQWPEIYGAYLSDKVTLYPPDDSPMVRAIRGEAVDSEEIFLRNDFRLEGIWISVSARPLRDDAGMVRGGIVVFQETTQRKHAEEHIRRLNDQLARRVDSLAALRRIDMEINGSHDLRLTLEVILDQVSTQLGVDATCVLVCDPHSHTLEYAAGKGFRTSSIARTRFRLGEGCFGEAAMGRRTLSYQDLSRCLESSPRSAMMDAEGFRAYWGVPMVAKGKVVGMLELFHREALDPDPDWHEFLEALARQTAIAMDNASMFEGMQRSNLELELAYDATIEGWSLALEMRDRETQGHSQRVTEMTMRLARAMGVGSRELIQIRRGALLHDIGKMGIPDAILLKPGPLDAVEWEVMQRHPTFAMEMLSSIPFLGAAVDIPYCHHEKWDGTGYPRGLKGERIPLAARIFAAVDIWDALRSDRPYRKGYSIDYVSDHIRKLADTHLDPRVVKAFLPLVEDDSPFR
ncbi:HD domain-containing phosphohydrolase, partial [Singulisphaera rosea]